MPDESSWMQKKLSKKRGLADYAVEVIKKLSKLEGNMKDKQLDPDAIKLLRKEQAAPILTEFKQWLDEKSNLTPPQSRIGIAIRYTLNQWDKFLTYLEDGRLDMSNNFSERCVKSFVIGRKNWLFANTVKGAESSAIIYSLIETCKIHHIEPYHYLQHALTHMPSAQTIEDIEKLLPYHYTPPINNE